MRTETLQRFGCRSARRGSFPRGPVLNPSGRQGALGIAGTDRRIASALNCNRSPLLQFQRPLRGPLRLQVILFLGRNCSPWCRPSVTDQIRNLKQKSINML